MPPSAPFSAAAVWEALSASQRRALEEWAEDAGVELSFWTEVPAIARAFSTMALLRLAQELQEERPGVKREYLLEAAAFRLSMNPDTAGSRDKRLKPIRRRS